MIVKLSLLQKFVALIHPCPRVENSQNVTETNETNLVKGNFTKLGEKDADKK